MKLIALRYFRNVGGKLKIENAAHPAHVHKGARFSIGQGETMQAVNDEDPKTGQYLAMLFVAQAVAEATAESIARVEVELEVDAKREARAKELDAAATVKGANASFLDLLARVNQLQSAPVRPR